VAPVGRAARALGYIVVCCVLPTMVWGWAGGVFGTGVAMTINRAPQLIELVRHADATGVSATSWFVGAFGVRSGFFSTPAYTCGRADRDGLRRSRQPRHWVTRDVATRQSRQDFIAREVRSVDVTNLTTFGAEELP